MLAPRLAAVMVDHVTLQTGTPANVPLPRETSATVVGEADDGAAVQALIVEIGESTTQPYRGDLSDHLGARRRTRGEGE